VLVSARPVPRIRTCPWQIGQLVEVARVLPTVLVGFAWDTSSCAKTPPAAARAVHFWGRHAASSSAQRPVLMTTVSAAAGTGTAGVLLRTADVDNASARLSAAARPGRDSACAAATKACRQHPRQEPSAITPHAGSCAGRRPDPSSMGKGRSYALLHYSAPSADRPRAAGRLIRPYSRLAFRAPSSC
jgi:hypothetical protein